MSTRRKVLVALTWFGARVVRNAFPVRLFHSLLNAGLSRRYPGWQPAPQEIRGRILNHVLSLAGCLVVAVRRRAAYPGQPAAHDRLLRDPRPRRASHRTAVPRHPFARRGEEAASLLHRRAASRRLRTQSRR